MRALPAVDLIAHLPLGIIHRNLALAAFYKHHQSGYQYHSGKQRDGHKPGKCTGSNQF